MRLGTLRALLIDLDGVVYRGEQALPGAVEFFAFLSKRGLRFSLITNNSTRTPAQFAEKLGRLDIVVAADQIITSAEATGQYLAENAGRDSRVLVIGELGLREAVRGAGLRLTDRNPTHVVVGLDERLTYAKLRRAALAIRNGAQFIASNADASLPTEGGEVPGAGAIVAALTAATGVEPVVIGKPKPAMLGLAMRRIGVDVMDTAIVGDRLETDVLAGHRLGMCTILVLTGVTTRNELSAASVSPDFVFTNLSALQAALESGEGRVAGAP